MIDSRLAGILHMTVLFESPPEDSGGFGVRWRPSWLPRHEMGQLCSSGRPKTLLHTHKDAPLPTLCRPFEII
jgi:hypothetical protein